MNLLWTALTALTLICFNQTAFASLDNIGKNMDKNGNEISQAHENINVQPVEAVAGTVFSTGGNTIKYLGRALSLVQTEGYEEIVEATIDSGACIARQAKNGEIMELTACGIEVGGKFLSITIDFVASQIGNLVYYVTEVTSDLSGIWLEAFDACARTLGEENWPKYIRPCTAIAVVFDYTGRLIRAIGLAIVDTVFAVGYDTSSLIVNSFNIPANIVRLQPEDALQSTAYALQSAACGILDIVLIIPRFLAEITGSKPMKECLQYTNYTGPTFNPNVFPINPDGGY